ncbi:hypothetical protein HDV03_004561 [Kappamyces sp. JEL0829]|nr:hypothetical protein HDV03_004561 [Kappamyces sp. JEL0829]
MQTTDQAPPSSSIRYDKLLASHQACLQSIAKECSLAKFAEALPMLQRNNPELLKELRDTVMNEWMTKTRSDFLDSVQDRELFPLLAGLDALAATASDKRAANAAELEPVTVMMSHRYALKQAEKARLLELLQQDVDENQQLFSQVQSQAAELEELSRRVQELKSGLLPSVVEDYLAAGEVLDFDTNFGPQTISLLELFSSSNLLELSWEIKKSLSGVKEHTDQIRTKFRDSRKKFLKERIARMKERLYSQKTLRLQDKITFVCGVTWIWLTCLFMFRFPDVMPLYYLFTIVPLVTIRFFVYRSKKWHYFLADLCYFVNFLIITFFFFHSSEHLFMAVFCLAHGPVAWAIYAWRNALVFHSVDKVTSIAIHIQPALALYTVRWLSLASPIRTISLLPSYANVAFNPRGDQSMDPSYIYAMFCASIVYLVWQGLYYYFILVLQHEKVFDLSHATSYTYLLTDYMGKKKNNPLTKLFKATPEAFRPFLFIIVQFIYALLTMLPTVVYYRSFWAHTAFIVFIVMLSVFNGADYYMEGSVSQLTSSL